MNKRLLAYLRSLGLDQNATEPQAWEYFQALRGAQASIGNALNYNEADEAARTTCDLMIRAAGFDPANPNNILANEQRQQTPAAPATPAASASTPAPGTDGASVGGDMERHYLEGAQREQRRVATINELAEMCGTPIEVVRTLTADPTITADTARQRIREDWNQRTRSTVSPDVPNAGPAIHSRNSQTDFNSRAMTAALMMNAGISDPTNHMVRFRSGDGAIERVNGQGNDEIHRAVERGYELTGLAARVFIQRALALDGIQCEPTTQSITRAFQTRGGAAMSTTSLVNIFTQTFGARLLQSYIQTVDTTRGWTIEGENPNYLPNQLVRVGLGESLAMLPRGGSAEHMGYGDETLYTKVYRYARQAVFDEIDLQNDNFGVITSRTPTIMGESAARLRPDLVYAILLANPTLEDGVALFHATHGNTAAAAWSESAAEAAFTAMSAQRIGTVNVNFTPAWVVHPIALDFAVDKVLNPSALVVTGENLTRPNNYAIGRKGLKHVGEPRLDNGVIDPKTGTSYAGDANDFYMTGEGSESPIEVTYLAGTNKGPRFRSGVLDQGQFGIWFDVQQAIGAKAIGYRQIFRRTS